MKKVIVGIFMGVLALSGTNIFAQFNFVATSPKNLKQLQHVIANAKHGSWKNVIVVDVPTHVVAGGKIGLMRAPTPGMYTPVTASLIDYRVRTVNELVSWGRTHILVLPNRTLFKMKDPLGKGYYTDSNELAAHLHRFYQGKGQVWVGPDNKLVKFYALPVDGILYQPAPYEQPLVLRSEWHFVIYDVESKTGQIVPNKPSIYEAYQRYVPAEPAPKPIQRTSSNTTKKSVVPQGPSLPARKKVEEAPVIVEEQPAPRLSAQESLQRYSQYHQDVMQLRQSGQTEPWWQAAGLTKQYSAGRMLGQAVVQFYELHKADLPAPVSVQQVLTGSLGKIYEFPVDGLEIKLKNGNVVNVKPEESVLFHSQEDVFSLINRAKLTDVTSFELSVE